jgi:type I restriction enzyme S subunit
VKVKDIQDGQIDTSDLLLTDPKIDAAYARSRLKADDLLFTIRGTVGRMALVPMSLHAANITQDTARISLADSNPIFVARWLEMERPSRFVAVHTLGVAVQGINLRDVRRIPVPTVPRPEQDQIANIVKGTEATIEREQQALRKLELVKSGLTAAILTGRVPVPESIAMEAPP